MTVTNFIQFLTFHPFVIFYICVNVLQFIHHLELQNISHKLCSTIIWCFTTKCLSAISMPWYKYWYSMCTMIMGKIKLLKICLHQVDNQFTNMYQQPYVLGCWSWGMFTCRISNVDHAAQHYPTWSLSLLILIIVQLDIRKRKSEF